MGIKPRKLLFKELKSEIVRHGLYAKDLARMIHMSESELSKKLNGKRPWLMQDIFAVMDALDIAPEKIAFYWPVEDVCMCG